MVLYATLYGWLPDIPQRLRTVLPGAVAGALMWLGAAAVLSYTLRSAGKLAAVYGSFTGLVSETLVFLYASAVTLIFGAEINAVLRDRSSGRTGRHQSDRRLIRRRPARPPRPGTRRKRLAATGRRRCPPLKRSIAIPQPFVNPARINRPTFREVHVTLELPPSGAWPWTESHGRIDHPKKA